MHGFEPRIFYFPITKALRDTEQLSRYSDGLLSGQSGVRFPAGTTDSAALHSAQAGSGTRPLSYAVGTSDAFSRVKRQGCETDNSPSPGLKGWEP
jgi:hypothetical protein